MAAGAWALLNIEVFAIVAGLALLLLAAEDLMVFFEGGDSLIGRMLGEEKSAQVRQFFAEVKETLGTLKDKAGQIWDQVQEKWPEVHASLNEAEESVQRAVNAGIALVGVVSELVDWGRAFGAAMQGTSLVIQAIAGYAKLTAQQVKIAADAVALIYSHGGGQVATVGSLALGGGGGGSTTDNSSRSLANNVTVNIHGAQDAQGIAKQAGDAVSDALMDLRQAFASF